MRAIINYEKHYQNANKNKRIWVFEEALEKVGILEQSNTGF